MKNKHYEDDYDIVKEKAKRDYKKIGRIWCPPLNDSVVFNSEGFRHLNQKKGVFRSKTEQKKRFALLPQAKNILENPGTVIVHQKRKIIRKIKWQGITTTHSAMVDYWIFTSTQTDKTIKLVARRFGQGKKHFLTIYEVDKKEKPPE